MTPGKAGATRIHYATLNQHTPGSAPRAPKRATRAPRAHHASEGHTGDAAPVDKFTALRRPIAEGKRPDPFRTRKLSPPAPMVLHPRECGRVGRRRTSHQGHLRVALMCVSAPVLHRPAQLAHQVRRLVDSTAREKSQDERSVIRPAAHRHSAVIGRGGAAFHGPAERAGWHRAYSRHTADLVGDEPERGIELLAGGEEQAGTSDDDDAARGAAAVGVDRAHRGPHRYTGLQRRLEAVRSVL